MPDQTADDIARIVTAWQALAAGKRTGLAFPFVATGHDIAYLGDRMCDAFSVTLASATAPIAAPDDWRCLGKVLAELAPPERAAATPGETNAWSTCARKGAPSDVRGYCTCMPVSDRDMCAEVEVGARGVARLALKLD